MDKGSILGILLVLIAVASGVYTGGEAFSSYINLPSILIVIVGTFGAVMLSYRPVTFFKALANIGKAFQRNVYDMEETIELCVELATTSRRHGYLGLENTRIDDPFIAKAVSRMVDGHAPEMIEESLNREIYLSHQRNNKSIKVLNSFSEVAPAMGMIGTLIGLVAMLMQMDDPSTIGSSMAVALLTTLYGAVIANGITTPLAKKLSERSQEILLHQSMVKDAIIQIINGENPRTTFDFLQNYVEENKRKAAEAAKEAA